MTLETQVATLVTATTDLSAVVNTELTKVRTENATFKAGVVEKAATCVNNGIVVFNTTSGKNIKGNPRAKIDNNGSATIDDLYIGLGTNPNGRPTTNCMVGFGANLPLNTGVYNTGFGCQVLGNNTSGYANAALGVNALFGNTTGIGNIGIGVEACSQNATGSFNVAIGHAALTSSSAGNIGNCVGIGYQAEVTGSQQIQLGNGAQTTYVYGTVQNRSDARDKADIRPTILGLDFIKLLKPVDYRWDMRDSYRVPMPAPLGDNASDEEKFNYEAEFKKYQEGNNLSNITHDGSKKKKRFHHGIVAQDVEDLIKKTGNDFGGFQNHKVSGGDDVLSIGYDEFIAPLIKGMQELAQMNEDLRARVATLEAKAI